MSFSLDNLSVCSTHSGSHVYSKWIFYKHTTTLWSHLFCLTKRYCNVIIKFIIQHKKYIPIPINYYTIKLPFQVCSLIIQQGEVNPQF